MSSKTRRIAVAVLATLAAFAMSVEAANSAPVAHLAAADGTLAAPFISPPPAAHFPFHWYRQHGSARALESRRAEFGSTAVVGLESNRDLAALRATYGFRHVTPIPQLHAAQVTGDRAEIGGLLAAAPHDARLRYVSPLGPRRKLQHLRNDPMLRQIDPATGAPYEWQFAAARVDLALNLSHGSPNVLACTIDSGVADVPDLAGKVVARWVFDGQTPMQVTGGTDVEGHGTAVASLIAANVDDGFGIAGFGGATRIISFRDEDLADTSVAIAMAKLVSLGCRIINMSFGGPDALSPILKDAIDRAFAQGVLLVASAGNDGADQPVLHPAADLQAEDGAPSMGLAVGASDFSGQPAPFSNGGSRLSLLAPGDYDNGCAGVLAAIPAGSTMFDNSCWARPGLDSGGAHYGSLAGTSFSAPEVAGVAALVWAARPDLENWQVAEILKRSARHEGPAWTPDRGFGVLDAAAALELATGRSSADALKITNLRTARSTKWLTASGSVTWSDGVPATDAKVDCSAGGMPATVTFTQGTFKCSWRIPEALTLKAIHGQVAADDPQIAAGANQAFTLGHPRVP